MDVRKLMNSRARYDMISGPAISLLHKRGPYLLLAGSSTLALLWLIYQFWRLAMGGAAVWSTSPPGAYDLWQRQREVEAWFQGRQIYGVMGSAVYPPATYAILAAVFFGLPMTILRWHWVLVCACSLGAACLIARRQVPDKLGLPVVNHLLTVFPAATYAAGAGIGNGQLTVPVVAALLVAVHVLDHTGSANQTILRDLAVGVLFLFALVKPTLAAPFFWLLAVRKETFGAACLVVAGYVFLTLAACTMDYRPMSDILQHWLLATTQTMHDSGYANIAAWSSRITADGVTHIFSMALLLATGVWCYCHRYDPVWRLAAVCALSARFLTKHLWYDDFVLVFVVLALVRESVSLTSRPPRRFPALLAATVAAGLISPAGPYILPPGARPLWIAVQTVLWLTGAGYLLTTARMPHPGSVRVSRKVRTG